MPEAEYLEMERLEGNLSTSEVQRLRRAHRNFADYLQALRREYAAVQEAIARLGGAAQLSN